MYSQYIEEQLLRCERALRALCRFRDHPIPVKRLEEMTTEDLADYGLTPENVANADSYMRAESWPSDVPMPESGQIRARLIEAASGIPPQLRDTMLFYFQQCFHLSDWIYSCPLSNIPKQVVLDFVRSNRLAVCADLANGTKHLRLTRSTFSGRSQAGGSTHTQGDGRSLAINR